MLDAGGWGDVGCRWVGFVDLHNLQRLKVSNGDASKPISNRVNRQTYSTVQYTEYSTYSTVHTAETR